GNWHDRTRSLERFCLGIDGRETGLRLVEWGANWRSRLLQLPYGDQALFLRRDTFWQVGGFPDLPMMEDFELVRRLRRRGRIAIAPDAVLTSARRWQKLGILKATVINQVAIVAYLIGISPDRIARWYRRQR
ncbi:MAG: glycosyltransferase, partial [Leptolyngbyaceae cyanobacterium SM1_3_5]|nr:glycosyltransferase [Leptolyngbyaceae cyanobacterium SM1_3_5]